MKFLSIYKNVERNTPPRRQEMADDGQTGRAGLQRGLAACHRRLPAHRTRCAGPERAKIKVTDGPFTESKEVVGGFAILKANSKAEAIQWRRTS